MAASASRAILLVVLAKLVARNFRSLELVEVRLEPLTALVGPNGAGKSAILRAIDFVMGQRYPSVNALRIPHDFTKGEITEEGLLLRVRLGDPVLHHDRAGDDHSIYGFQVSAKPYKRRTGRSEAGDLNFDLLPYDAAGEQPTVCVNAKEGVGRDYRPLRQVSNELRDPARVLFIDHRRSVVQHQPWARNSILARLLAPARKDLEKEELTKGVTYGDAFRERYQEATEALRTPQVRAIEEVISETAKRTLGFLGSKVLDDLDVRFGFIDPSNPFASLRLNFVEGDLELPAEELGSGVQSAIVVGIFEAFRQMGGAMGTVLIEEPEMFLHPQAQRYLYGLLTEIVDSGQGQVIYSTHSPVFAGLERFEAIRLIRREPGAGSTVSAIRKPQDIAFLEKQREREKLHAFHSSRSELFFARRVLLVEGAADALAVRRAAKARGLDLDAEGLTVIDCGSKSSIPFIARVARALEIPVAVMCDDDLREDASPEETKHAETLNARITEALGDDEVVIALSPSLEETLGISRDASDKPYKVANALETKPAGEWPPELAAALDALVGP